MKGDCLEKARAGYRLDIRIFEDVLRCRVFGAEKRYDDGNAFVS